MNHGEVQARLLGDDTVCVELFGVIKGEVLDTLDRTLVEALLRHRPSQMIVDLRGVTFIDSMALGSLDAVADTARDLGTELTIFGKAALMAG